MLVLDQLTKVWAVERLSDGRQVELIGSLRLRLALNPGAAFSLASGASIGPFIAILALVVVGFLLFSGSTTRSKVGAVAVGLVAGGALGNLVDRAFRSGSGFFGGHVVDFIDLQWWPVFNVADVGVVVGAIALVVVSARAPASDDPAHDDPASDDPAEDGPAQAGSGAGSSPSPEGG